MQTLAQARDRARRESEAHNCVQHVNALIGYDHDSDAYGVVGYSVSSWEDDSTVETFSGGRLQSTHRH